MPTHEGDTMGLMDTVMEFDEGFRSIYPDIDFVEDSRRNRQRYLRFRK